MRNFEPTVAIVQSSPWTCLRCLQRWRASRLWVPRINRFTTRRTEVRIPKISRRTLLLAAAGGTAGASVMVGLSDDLKHVYAAARRSGRVLSTLLVCINDYRTTLNNKPEHEEEWQSFLKGCHQRCANRTLGVLEQNGSIFIKLGQHLSSMNYLLPIEWTTTFIPLQDQCPVSSYESIEKMFISDTGASIADHFDDFEREPIGTASLAQVHRATMKGTGQRVAVKVQHPALEEWVPLDLALTRLTFSWLKRVFPQYDLEWLSNEMESSLPQELNFALEGENAMRTKEYFGKLQDIPLIIPDVKWGLKRILVMEYVSGHRTDDLDFIDSNDIDRDEVSATLARIFNEMIFGDCALHCDPHGGNIAIRRSEFKRKSNFEIVLYDHGLYREIPKQLQRDYAKLWLAVINADEQGMRQYAFNVAGITADQFPLFASAITGRDYRAVTRSVISIRSVQEKEQISGAMSDGMLQQLVQLLGQVPRIILLILKTNDLTRSLDENLHTREGPVRNFMILARYCSRTVFREQLETIGQHGSVLWPKNFLRFIQAWSSYMSVELKLSLYEYYMFIRRMARPAPVTES